ncbi:hypothetical protein E2C01_022857 [Portunus trituberculatus]|uniref:Uncharacterized protein n=1 Tax=Portunus trituberculatus TaxID=210409 RepID=A0A5B7E8F9_PORTR|nr:hypothetical protein [Portunus trituberculatus]
MEREDTSSSDHYHTDKCTTTPQAAPRRYTDEARVWNRVANYCFHRHVNIKILRPCSHFRTLFDSRNSLQDVIREDGRRRRGEVGRK